MSITFEHVTKRFDRAVLDDCTLHFADGRITALVGESGRGRPGLLFRTYWSPAAGGDFTQTKIPVIVRLRGSPSAQDRNNDILLRYTNKRKNVRIATYTHVFLCLNIILAEQTSR